MRPLQRWLTSRGTTERIKVTRDCLAYADPLAQYDSVSPGCSYWPRDQEKECYDRCIEHGLGSLMRWQTSLRDMVRNGEVVAHKLSGALCCTPSARVLSPRHSSPSRSHQDGQHDSGSIYKSPRRCKLATTAVAGERPPSVGRLTPPLHPGSTCPRTPEHVTDLLSRGGVIHGEWRLHSLTVNMIWSVFGRAEMDLFASAENTHCPLFYSLTHSPLGVDALAHSWSKVCK